MLKSIEQAAVSRIYRKGRGWAFCQDDFADLGSRSAIDLALHRREKEGLIRRVLRGGYDYPRYSELLKKAIGPDVQQVAQAMARKFGWRIQPDGETAQNLLGLSTQVPARVVYLSDGRSRSCTVGNTAVVFQHTALKEAGFKFTESRLVVQALKAFGEEGITPKVIATVRRRFEPRVRRRILLDTRTATGWVYAAIQKIAEDPLHG